MRDMSAVMVQCLAQGGLHLFASSLVGHRTIRARRGIQGVSQYFGRFLVLSLFEQEIAIEIGLFP